MEGSDHKIRESKDKIRTSVKIKRGTGTRDQDTYQIKARGRTPDEVAHRIERTIGELKDRGTFEEIRQLQPDD